VHQNSIATMGRHLSRRPIRVLLLIATFGKNIIGYKSVEWSEDLNGLIFCQKYQERPLLLEEIVTEG
jgi:hypothetical protein